MNWKYFLLDKEKLSLFISLLIFFPSPFFFIVIIGFAPTVSLALIGYTCKPDRGSFLIIILTFIIVGLNIIFNCFLLKIIVNILIKMLRRLFKTELTRRITLAIIIFSFIVISCSLDIYSTGDAGGGEHRYNFITLYKDFLLSFF